MPTVPYISQPRVSPNALPGVRRSVNAPIEAFGGGVAAQQIDLSGPANVAGNIAQQNALDRQRIRSEAALEADQIAVTKATSVVQNSVNDFSHGPNGIFNRHGTDAMTIDQEAYDHYGKTVADVRAQLTNDRQRAVFDKYAVNGWDAWSSQFVPYIARERAALDKESTDAAVTAAKNAVIGDPLNPVIQEHSTTVVKAVKTDQAVRLGLEGIAAKVYVDDAVSDIHLSAIHSILSQPNAPNKDRLAAAYFDAHKGELVGKDKLDADRLVKQSLMEGDVLRTTDKIIASTTNEIDADAEIDKQIEDPVMRERAKQHLSAVYNRKIGMQRDAQNRAFEAGSKIFRAHHSDPTAIPITMRDAMGEMHWRSILSEAEHDQMVARRGPPSDPEVEPELRNQASLDPEAFIARDLSEVRGRLNTVDFRRMQVLQSTTRARLHREEQRELLRVIDKADKEGTTASDALMDDPALAKALGGKVAPKTPPAPSVLGRIKAAVVGNPAADKRAIDAAATGVPARPPAMPFFGDDFGEEPQPSLKAPTRQMLEDVMRKGPQYAEYLRSMNIDIPDGVPTSPPVEAKAAEPKPAVHETVVKRGPDGKIVSTTTTVTKPGTKP